MGKFTQSLSKIVGNLSYLSRVGFFTALKNISFSSFCLSFGRGLAYLSTHFLPKTKRERSGSFASSTKVFLSPTRADKSESMMSACTFLTEKPFFSAREEIVLFVRFVTTDSPAISRS